MAICISNTVACLKKSTSTTLRRLNMDTPIIDLEELLEEAKDRIEEKLMIEGEFENEWY